MKQYYREGAKVSLKEKEKRSSAAPKIVAGIFIFLAVLATGWMVYGFLFPDEGVFSVPFGHEKEEMRARAIGHRLITGMKNRQAASIEIVQGDKNPPLLALIIDTQERWEGYPATSQRAMCLYVQSLTPEAQILVSTYLPQGQAHPRYTTIAPNVQMNLCSTCWVVQDRSGKVLVAGNKAWASLPNAAGVETLADIVRKARQRR